MSRREERPEGSWGKLEGREQSGVGAWRWVQRQGEDPGWLRQSPERPRSCSNIPALPQPPVGDPGPWTGSSCSNSTFKAKFKSQPPGPKHSSVKGTSGKWRLQPHGQQAPLLDLLPLSPLGSRHPRHSTNQQQPAPPSLFYIHLCNSFLTLICPSHPATTWTCLPPRDRAVVEQESTIRDQKQRISELSQRSISVSPGFNLNLFTIPRNSFNIIRALLDQAKGPF